MHLWPSERLRESFKHEYLRKIHWNLHLMSKSNSSSSSNTNNSGMDGNRDRDGGGASSDPLLQNPNPAKENLISLISLCRDILFLCSCCCCCLCCGACDNEEEES